MDKKFDFQIPQIGQQARQMPNRIIYKDLEFVDIMYGNNTIKNKKYVNSDHDIESTFEEDIVNVKGLGVAIEENAMFIIKKGKKKDENGTIKKMDLILSNINPNVAPCINYCWESVNGAEKIVGLQIIILL